MRRRFAYDIPVEDTKVMETIAVSQAVFLSAEAEKKLSHLEFLAAQSRLVKKRWWLLQGLLLSLVSLFLCHMEADYLTRRALGLAGPLFVILILPELWKNRNFDAMEVECTTYYTIRSIYAARLTLFAGVDLLLLSIFFIAASVVAQVTLWEMVIQFVLPFNVTCCICFRTLYARRIRSEALAMLLCILWAGFWAMLIMSNSVYSVISVPIWIAALAVSVLGMYCTLCQGKGKWQQTLEVKPLWI